MQKELVTERELRHALLRKEIDPDNDMPTLKRVDLDPDGQITILQQKRTKRQAA